jgi:hypothetical protein
LEIPASVPQRKREGRFGDWCVSDPTSIKPALNWPRGEVGLRGPPARPVAADDELPVAAVSDRDRLADRRWRWRDRKVERSNSFSAGSLERISVGRCHDLSVDVGDVAVPEPIRWGRTGPIAVECCQEQIGSQREGCHVQFVACTGR